MNSSGNDIEVQIGAKVDELQRGMDQAAQSVEDGAQRMDGSSKTMDGLAAARRAAAERLRVERENIDAILSARLSAIDAEETEARHAVDMDKSTKAVLLQQQIEFENQRSEAKRAALQAELALAQGSGDLSDQASLNRELEQEEQTHQAILTAIRNKSEVDEYNRAKRLSAIKISSATDAAMASVDADQQAADQSYALGITSNARMIELDAAFEMRRNQIKSDALQARLALVDRDNDPEAFAAIKAQIESLEAQHQLRMTEIDNQAELERNQYQLGAIDGIGQASANAVRGLITQQQTLGQTFRNIWADVLGSVANLYATFVKNWITKKLSLLILEKQTVISEMSSAAAKAGANGVASMAGAPYPLNMGAPAFGKAMAAAALAFAPAASALADLTPSPPAHARPLLRLLPE